MICRWIGTKWSAAFRGSGVPGVATLILAMAQLLAASPVTAQQGTLAGTVVDSRSMQPIVGAQVMVSGTTQGTITDARGRFQLLNVQGTEVGLRVQMLGFRAHTESARVGATDLRIALQQSAIELDGIVVTGTTGNQERRAIGNSVTTIDAAQVNLVAPVSDVGMMLNARSPGVIVMPGTGMVGAGSRIRIRGASSFSLNDQPLIYVDGVRVNNDVSSGPSVQGFGSSPISRLGDINPADIESIEVIKGPAAATLYGTEAANGVVQIITKRGRAGDRPQISAFTRQGVNWFANAETRVKPAVYRDASGQIQEMNLVRSERERGTPIWTPGRLQGYGVDVSGGSETFRYHASTNYDADNGIEPTNSLRRVAGRLNLTFAPWESMEVSTNLGLITSTTDLARENGGTWFATRLASPQFLNTPQRGFWTRPPEVTWAAHRDFQELKRFIAGVQTNHRVTDWFSHRLTVGLDLTGENNQSITERMDDEMARFYTAQAALGTKSVDRRDVSYTTVDYGGTFRFGVAPELNSNSSFGVQYYRKLIQTASATGNEFPAPNLRTISATAVTFGSDNFVENATVGVYAQQQFDWRNRLFLTGAVRADDNSAFGENFSLVVYPKLSASWVLSEEPFWNVPLVDAMRLRFAFGASGQQPESFAALRTYGPITTGSGGAALTPQFIGNPDLAPERGEELEVGFESSLFNQRFGIDFTYFNQRTRDAILLRQQPPSLGFPSSQYVNVGAIRNSGAELQLRALAMQGPRANLELLFNLSRNRNEVLDLGGEEFIALGAQQHRVGYPIASWFEQKIPSAPIWVPMVERSTSSATTAGADPWRAVTHHGSSWALPSRAIRGALRGHPGPSTYCQKAEKMV